MSRFSEPALLSVALPSRPSASAARALDDFPGVGRAATPAEIKAWNIDVRPDFAGPAERFGQRRAGRGVWEGKCAGCHGTFGESNKVFTPLVGGVEKAISTTGHVAALKRTDFPARTTFMKVATVSTLFDYIRRAMPWNAPKSLSDDEVYAVLAYLLNLVGHRARRLRARRSDDQGGPEDHAQSQRHDVGPCDVAERRFGGKAVAPDTANTPCMKDCKKEPEIGSVLPDYALSSHGNLADQNRRFGPVRGQVTAASVTAADAAPSPAASRKLPVASAAMRWTRGGGAELPRRRRQVQRPGRRREALRQGQAGRRGRVGRHRHAAPGRHQGRGSARR